jgi:PhzF family phenazine biosynthesis protein
LDSVTRRFQQVDVFGSGPFSGNPLAVVHDADGLTTEQMQDFTRWANLSESAFLLQPMTAEADYRVRIFTLARELPFAGHPTLGSCHAWLSAGGSPVRSGVVLQECGAGLIRVRRSRHGLGFAAPPLLRSGPVEESLVHEVEAVLGLKSSEVVDMQWADNGPGWIAVLLADADAVLAVRPDFSRSEESLDIGLVGPYPAESEVDFEVRAIFADDRGGSREDPVTGSLNASLGQWLLAGGRATAPYTVSQGTALGRRGRVHVEQDPDGMVWIGGATTTAIEGHVDI